MNPVNWVLIAFTTLFQPAGTMSAPQEVLPSLHVEKQEGDRIITAQEEAQWGAWEAAQEEKERREEEEFLSNWLPVSNSQMPYKEDL